MNDWITANERRGHLTATQNEQWQNRLIYGDNLLAIAALLVGDKAMPSLRGKIDSLAIEGHTDDQGSDPFNLKLSQERSLAVMVKGLEVIQATEPASYQCFQEITSAAGRGRQDLVYESIDVVNREKSRRVIFKIRLRSAEQRDRIEQPAKAL